MQDFRKLHVWSKAHQLTIDVYKAFGQKTPPLYFSLRNQLTRAVASVPANLAEGCGHSTDREFRRYVRIALGSASESEYHFLLARDLGLLPEAAYEKLALSIVEIKRMLSGLAASLGDKDAES
ncbi:MAG: four helix bundle protein [Vicinamibacterales bacterium]